MNVWDVVRLIGAFLSLGGFIVILSLSRYYLAHDKSGRMIYTLPLIVWTQHGLIYYLIVCFKYVFIGLAPTTTLSVWSMILRLHGIIAVATMMYFLNRRNGKIAANEAVQQTLTKLIGHFDKTFEEMTNIDLSEA